MKKNYIKILLLAILMVTPLKGVKAESANIILDCPNKISTGKTITCTISGNATDISISSLEGKIITSGNIEIQKFTTDKIWEGNGNDGSVDLYTEENKTSDFAIGTVTIKIKDETNSEGGVITLNNFTFYDSKFQPITINNISKNIAIASNDNYLSTLSINCANLKPMFDKDKLSYTAICETNSVNITASVNDTASTLKGTGTKSLTYGNNYFTVTVTSESGLTKDYKIVITKPDDRPNVNKPTDKEENNNDSSLKSILISGYNIDFNSNVYEYTLNVGPETEEIDISYITNNENATVEITGSESLKFGNNEIKITVTAVDKSTSTYTLNVIRSSKECIVNNIDILGYDFNFNCNNYNYELKIKDEDSLNIVVFLNNNAAKTKIYNNYNLKNNEVIKINVNLSGEIYEYNIKILKDEKSNILLIIAIVLGLIIIGLIIGYIIYKNNKKKKISNNELNWVINTDNNTRYNNISNISYNNINNSNINNANYNDTNNIDMNNANYSNINNSVDNINDNVNTLGTSNNYNNIVNNNINSNNNNYNFNPTTGQPENSNVDNNTNNNP